MVLTWASLENIWTSRGKERIRPHPIGLFIITTLVGPIGLVVVILAALSAGVKPVITPKKLPRI